MNHHESQNIEQEYYTIQKVLLPVDNSNAELYLRFINGFAGIDEHQVVMEKGAKVSFNTYFNSFYQNYWEECTTLISDLVLQIEFSGAIRVEIFRDTNNGTCRLINWKKCRSGKDEKETVHIPIMYDAGLSVGGRLFIEIKADKNSKISNIIFQTSDTPRQKPSLTLTISTHNREKVLYRSLKNILSHTDLLSSLAKIIVVNQGSPFVYNGLVELIGCTDLIKLIEPDGQKSESCISLVVRECLEYREATHHVLMADNAFIDACVLSNLKDFLSYVSPDIVVTSHMLDILRPWLLYSADAIATPYSQAHNDSIDLRDLDALASFNKYHLANDTPRWLCAFPTGHLKEVTVPTAISSRADEVELGFQFRETGIRTVAVPGIAVWHDKPVIDRKCYSLQEIMLPVEKTISELYLRIINGNVEVDNHQLVMGPGAKVSFNTYFNSFYESYWTECTAIEDIVLRVEFSGSIHVEIFRDTKHQGVSRIFNGKLSSDGAAKTLTDIQLCRDDGLSEAGRLFVDLTAEVASKIRNIVFQTTTSPIHEPSITLGICTFNREPFLYRNLNAILNYKDALQSIEKIIVVNQGPSFTNKELAALIDRSDLIKLVEQKNFGGCGGFTRTMHESLEFHDATHHVLMDDDAVIDPRILHNLENFLAYASRDIVVGGHMLDLLRPWVLYEAGANVKPNSRIKLLHHNIDLRSLESLLVFNKCHFVDYNAWWFCAIPTKHIKEARFPAPIFIRGDDMEYGVRLQEKGVKTVAMPGIAVWHEPFYVKVGGWQIYYDLRNRLIMASVYPHRFSLESPKNVIWLMMQALALHDYFGARLICKALQDYLKGPSLFETDAEAIHKEVTQLGKILSPESVGSTEGFNKPKLTSMPKSDLSTALLLVRRIMTLLLSFNAGERKPMLLMDNEASVANVGPFPYVKTNAIGSYRLLYRPNRIKLQSLLVLCLKTFAAYLRNRKQAAEAWRMDIDRLRSGKAWAKVFNAEGAAADSDIA